MATQTRASNRRAKWPRDELIKSLVTPQLIDFIRNVPRPLLAYSSGRFPPGSESRPHAHPCVALHACLQGVLTIATADATLELQAGTLCLIPAGARHFSRNLGDRVAVTLNLLVDTEHPGRWPRESGVAECCRELQRLVGCVRTFNVSSDADLAHTFWQIADRVADDRPCSTAATTGFLWALIGQLVERLSSIGAVQPPASDLPQRARRFLLARLEQQLQVAEVARAMNVSATRLQELFRLAYGCGIIHYFNQMKIWRAQRLLAESRMTIEQVSRKLGFSSATYFARVFLRYTGQSPGQFRASR